MTSNSSRQTHRNEVETLLRNEDFEEALDMLSSVESSRDLDANEFVTKGRAILLTSEEANWSLAAAEEAFQKALTSDIDLADLSALEDGPGPRPAGIQDSIVMMVEATCRASAVRSTVTTASLSSFSAHSVRRTAPRPRAPEVADAAMR